MKVSKRVLKWKKVDDQPTYRSECGRYVVWRNALGRPASQGGDGPEWAAARAEKVARPSLSQEWAQEWLCSVAVSRTDAQDVCEKDARKLEQAEKEPF